MKTLVEPNTKKIINTQIAEVIKLYGNSSITALLNDLVAVGTWPTPEKPLTLKGKLTTKTGGMVAIDTVPLPERTKKLKEILSKLVKTAGDLSLEKLMV
jgi:hypothetical protein